jgi:hypothetical protein
MIVTTGQPVVFCILVGSWVCVWVSDCAVFACLFTYQSCFVILGCIARSYQVAIHVDRILHKPERAIHSSDMSILVHAAPLDKVGMMCRHVCVKVYRITCGNMSVGCLVEAKVDWQLTLVCKMNCDCFSECLLYGDEVRQKV